MKHQLAMTAGIQAALTALLREFDPDRYERQFEEGIVFQKKAKCWDAYVKAYSRLTAEALENFFGDDFAEAYERQVRALAKKT
jgi:predicted component of type VI protein secretion system